MTAETIDVATLIEQYREASKRAVTAADERARDKWRGLATLLYKRWQQSNRDQDLHTLAFGEPAEK